MADFTGDEDIQKAIESWISKGKYTKLLDLWVKGMTFDWNKLYKEDQSQRPRRISAPAYPFARDRYWLRDRGSQATGKKRASESSDIFSRSERSENSLSEEGQEDMISDNYTPMRPQRGIPDMREIPLTENQKKIKSEKPGAVCLEDPESVRREFSCPCLEKPSLIRLDFAETERKTDHGSPAELYDCGEGVYCVEITGDLHHNTLEEIFHVIKGKVVLITGGERIQEKGACLAIPECDVPVIGVMKDEVTDSGWLLGSVCDFMVCSEESSYQYFTQSPSEEEFQLFEERFGRDFARELLFSGKGFTGRELHEKGLGIPVLPRDEAESYALDIAYRLCKMPRNSLVLLKRHLSREIAHRVRELSKSFTPISKHTDIIEEKQDIWHAWSQEAAETPDTAYGVAEEIQIGSQVARLEAYDNGVALITLCDRDSKNTFSDAFVQGVIKAFNEIRENPRYKVVIITGYDHYFACGATREGLLAIQEKRAEFSEFPLYELPLFCEIPVIAAMGHSIGGGWSLGLYCDVGIFSEESVYTTRFMDFGFTPGFGSTLIFPYKLGKDLGREVLFTANQYKGAELKKRGIPIPVLPGSEVLNYAMKVASQMAISSREDLTHLKDKSCHNLRNQLKWFVSAELAMHEETFTGSQEVLQKIQNEYEEGFQEEQEPSLPETGSDDETILGTIRKRLRQTLADELYMNQEDVDDDVQFVNIGLDSVIGVSWIGRINKEYGLSVAATKVYNYPTISEFAEYVLRQGKEQGLFLSQKKDGDSQTLPKAGKPGPPLKERKRLYFRDHDNVSRDLPKQEDKTHVIVREQEHKTHAIVREQKHKTHAIAVVGMSGQFPKSGTLDKYWDNLVSGQDCISEIPGTRWDINQYYDPDPGTPGKTYCRHMGALEDADMFDPLFFNISPGDAELMDPQERLFLQASWHCLEDGGYNPSDLSGMKCGVFAGCSITDYRHRDNSLLMKSGVSAHALMSGATAIIPSMVSYFLNLQGPCLSIDTACSSSLVAIASACDSLVLGASDLALAGGVHVIPGPEIHVITSKANMLSEDGRCFTFDKRANGFVPGEGVGVLLLKRLEDAERDKDQIHGVIAGWGVKQDGKTNGITAPSPDSQARLQREVYEKYSINPGEIQLIEAHGIGTKLGDPIEVEGLTKSFQSRTNKKNYCALGSVKSNIGHLLMAAGVAGVVKVLLSLKYQKIPPTANYEELNEHIKLKDSPFYVNTECRDWIVPEGQKRRSGISSFGLAGTNAHIVVEEHTEKREYARDEKEPAAIVLSAKDKDRLREMAENIHCFITNSSSDLADLAYTLQVGRQDMEERLGVIVRSKEELGEKLKGFIEGRDHREGLYTGQVKGHEDTLAMFKIQEIQEGINKLTERKELSKLLELWVKGVNFDWNRLYAGNNRPHRISAPTYPFARERYWNKTGGFSSQVPEGEISADEKEPAMAGQSVSPASMENQLIRIIGEVTGMKDTLDKRKSLQYDYGLDSIGLIGIQRLIAERFSITLKFDEIMQDSSIENILNVLKDRITPDITQEQSLARSANSLSSYQRLMLNINRVYKRHHVHTTFFKTLSEVSSELLKDKVSQISENSALLRSTFEVSGLKEQKPGDVGNIVKEYDFRGVSEESKKENLALLYKPEIDLTKEMPWKISVIRWNKQETIVGISFHHIAYDAYSFTKLLIILKEIFQGRQAERSETDYSTFVSLEDGFHTGPQGKEGEAFWSKQLENSQIHVTYKDQYTEKQSVKKIPPGTGREYEKVLAEYEDLISRTEYFSFPKEETQKAREFCKRNRIIDSSLLQYVYMMSIAKLSDQKDILMGNIVTYPRDKKLENVMGPCVNVIFSRLVIEENMNLPDHLRQFHNSLIKQFDYMWYPQDKILEMKHKEWDLDPSMFDYNVPIIFDYVRQDLNIANEPLKLGEIELTKFDPEKYFILSNTDLFLIMSDMSNEIKCNLRIKSHKFKKIFERDLIDSMKKLLSEITEEIK